MILSSHTKGRAPEAEATGVQTLPSPQPDLEAYRREKEACLSASRLRRENYERFEKSGRKAHLDYSPVKMDIENVSRCNFRCPKCQVSRWEGHRRAPDMSFDAYKRLIDSMHGLVEIKLQGMGEPLLGGAPFFAMIEYARSKHIWVRTTTNASLLHAKDSYKRLIDADPNEVQISVDGASKETFETIRVGSEFDLVTRNCRLINSYCHDRKLLKTRMWVCIQQQNIHEFLDFVNLAYELGFQRLSFALNLHGWGQEEHFEENRALAVDDVMTVERGLEAVEIGRRIGVDVSFWNNVSKYDTSSKETLCPWPFERAFISSDLRTVPCCMIANPEVLDLGDATQFEQVWHSRTYQEFRQAHLDGEIPLPCRSCYLLEPKR